MHNLIRSLAILAGVISGAAHATTVHTDVNCRSQPLVAARIVARIPAGSDVTVQQRRDAWSRVKHSPRSCWIASRYLGEQSTADANRASLRQTRAVTRDERADRQRISRPGRRAPLWAGAARHSSRRQSRPRSAPVYNYDGGSCPCSGRNICVGPRGGRYCITSGGNKRYGV